MKITRIFSSGSSGLGQSGGGSSPTSWPPNGLSPFRHPSFLALRGVRLCCAPCKVLVFSGCNSHPATGSLQPVAIGAAVEVTKPSEPSRQLYRLAMQRADRP